MTTDEQHERSVAELASLDTYQGMTDEEIERLFEFKSTLMAREMYAKRKAGELTRRAMGVNDGQETQAAKE
jgi:hypothetical protein